MSSAGPDSLPKGIWGSAPYAEHVLKVSWAEAEGTDQAPKRGCLLLLSFVENTSEPTVPAAAWGSQFQRLQSKVESFFLGPGSVTPMH